MRRLRRHVRHVTRHAYCYNAAAAESQRIAAQVPAYVYRDRVWYVRVHVIRS
jgi:hypothetical protein